MFRTQFIDWLNLNCMIDNSVECAYLIGKSNIKLYLYGFSDEIRENIYQIKEYEDFKKLYLTIDPISEDDIYSILYNNETIEYSEHFKKLNKDIKLGKALREYMKFLYFKNNNE